MPVPLDRIMEGLPPERRAAVERHARDLIAEHRTLAQLRKALNLTQADVADALETSQANVAQIERKTDVMLSTLSRVVRALGGELQLVVTLPNRPSVALRMGKSGGEPAVRGPRKVKQRTVATAESRSGKLSVRRRAQG